MKCAICQKNVTTDPLAHRDRHLYDLAASSLVYLEDIVSPNRYRRMYSLETLDRIRAIISGLKKALYIDIETPLFYIKNPLLKETDEDEKQPE